MSVTRDGMEAARPGRDARSWSGAESAYRKSRPRTHARASYYDEPIINPPVWEEREIAGYLFTGGLAGASSILATGAELSGRPVLARRAKLCASGAITASLGALIYDLGRPARFINMLRVFKPTSPMSVGTWILAAYSPLSFATSASAVLGRYESAGRAAGVGAGALGAAVSTYTAALIANTSVPAWREGRRELPFLFAGSAASAAGGFGLIAAPLRENAPALRFAALGAAAELGAEELLTRRLGMISETLEQGTAKRRLKAAKLLTAAGAGVAVAVGRRNRLAAAGAGAALVAGSALTRFGLFAAGMASAKDPKYTVVPQRERLEAARRESLAR
ncbi:MAG TPA: NrfD/PsrC family molybdoenzyme membrane anchor subunit [Solirubrobacteraceae bacterium]|nr:NrfD/PsrC family molybdoenzyme membrane anchor subunit [Solirubrobacteraceae bacterium]